MKMKNFSDFALFVTSFCLTVFLLVQGLPFIPTSSDEHHKVQYQVLVSVLCSWVMAYLVDHHLVTNDDQIVGLSDFIIMMHTMLNRHHILSILAYTAPAAIGLLMIVDRPRTMGAVTVSIFTFAMSGCSLYTTPRAAAIVSRYIINVPVFTLGPVIFGRSNKVVLGLLLLLGFCCFRSVDSDIEGKEQTKLVGGTQPESFKAEAEPLLSNTQQV